MLNFTKEELDGLTKYNSTLRYRISGDKAICGNNQRAEFFRLCAETFGTTVRAPALWFTLAKTRRNFLRIDTTERDFKARVILAKCVVEPPQPDSKRVQWERVRPAYSPSPAYNTLSELLNEDASDDNINAWNFNSCGFNVYGSPKTTERIAFFLQWDYEFQYVPDWLPEYLRPFSGIDPNPYKRD